MSENINCYKAFLPKDKVEEEEDAKKPKRNDKQEDTKTEKGKYQKVGDWMRHGGKNPSMTC